MRKAKDKTLMYRDTETVKKIVQMYRDQKLNFCIKNSSYSTVIETEKTQIRFITNNYTNAVFMASQKIKSDVKNSELGQAIMAGNYPTQNYDSRNGQESGSWPKIVNIDIRSAYATCLLNSGLITKDTKGFSAWDPRACAHGRLSRLVRGEESVVHRIGVGRRLDG